MTKREIRQQKQKLIHAISFMEDRVEYYSKQFYALVNKPSDHEQAQANELDVIIRELHCMIKTAKFRLI